MDFQPKMKRVVKTNNSIEVGVKIKRTIFISTNGRLTKAPRCDTCEDEKTIATIQSSEIIKWALIIAAFYGSTSLPFNVFKTIETI